MAPLVSPFCSPLSSTILERAGVPAGKQSRPIAPLPYPKWTNRGPSRRAKMNGSLSPHWLASLWSSLLPMLPTLSCFFSAAATSRSFSLHYTTLSRFVHTTILFVLLSSPLCVQHRSTLFSASAVLFTTLPYTLYCCAAFRRLARYFYSLFLFLSRHFFFFLCFSLISTLFFLYTLFSRLLFLAASFFSCFAF